jgi:DNA invertase Pin-like site-specific DNA recombinase
MYDVIVIVDETKEGKMKIAVYYRCSTDMQSVQHQKNSVAAWIKSKGYSYPVIEFSDEGVSGAVAARKGFTDLISAIKKGEVKKVILFELSRASRDMMAFLNFISLCEEMGCEVEVVGEGVQAFESPSDKLMMAVQAFLAEAEREKISQRVKSGIAKYRADPTNKPWGARPGSHANRGFRKTYPTALVDNIVSMKAQGLTLESIASILSQNGNKISRGTVANILRRQSAKPQPAR